MKATIHTMRAAFHSSGFVMAMASLAVIAVAASWWMVVHHASGRAASERLGNLRREWERASASTPPPTRQASAALAAALERVGAEADALRAGLKPTGRLAAGLEPARIPASRADAYFDLTDFCDRMREQARQSGVEVRAEAAKFGFGEFAGGSPPDALIPAVYRQRVLLEAMLEALLAARPRTLLRVLRVGPDDGNDPANSRTAGARTAPIPNDTWGKPPADRVRHLGSGNQFTTAVFRLVFTGTTSTLRDFLNRLVDFEGPAVVRELEVAPASEDEIRREETAVISGQPVRASAASVVLQAAAADAGFEEGGDRPAPIIPSQWGRFSVTIEYFETMDAIGTVDSSAGAEKPGPRR